MKFQYISDIHLEIYNITKPYYINKNNFFENIIKKLDDCENICLLGDIGYPESQIYQDFLTYCSLNWKNVFLIMGNHEFYRYKYITTISEIERFVENNIPKNVYFLNNKCIYLNKSTQFVQYELPEISKENWIKIIGTILWSNISDKTALRLNDYKKIYITKHFSINKLTPNITRIMFYSNKKFILNELACNFNCLLLTHHGIHELCNGYYINSDIKDGYTSDIPEILESNNLIANLFGHVHSNINLEINGIKLLSNAYGYKGENKNIVKYDKYASLEIS